MSALAPAAAGGITVTARFRARPGQAEARLPLLVRLADHSRREPGCADYGYFRQSDDFTSIEHWASPEDEAAQNDPDVLRQILPLPDGRPQVRRWQRVA